MNVTLEKIDDVTAILNVAIEENDYQEKVTKELKEFGRTHTIPGFRKGHVSIGPAAPPLWQTSEERCHQPRGRQRRD